MNTRAELTYRKIWAPTLALAAWHLLATNQAALHSAGAGLIGMGGLFDVVIMLLVVVGRVVTLAALLPTAMVALVLSGWRLWGSRARTQAS